MTKLPLKAWEGGLVCQNDDSHTFRMCDRAPGGITSSLNVSFIETAHAVLAAADLSGELKLKMNHQAGCAQQQRQHHSFEGYRHKGQPRRSTETRWQGQQQTALSRQAGSSSTTTMRRARAPPHLGLVTANSAHSSLDDISLLSASTAFCVPPVGVPPTSRPCAHLRHRSGEHHDQRSKQPR